MAGALIVPGSIVSGPNLPESVEVLAVTPMGQSMKIIGRGRQTGQTYDPVLTPQQIATLTVSAEREPFDGDARRFRLGIEAYRLGLAYEYDPFFSLYLLEKLLRDMYARQTEEHKIHDRIVRDVSPERFRAITESALEGLAKKQLNLSAIVGRSAEAKERRLVPEVVEQFFVDAAPESGLHPKPLAASSHCYRVGRVPKNLLPVGNRW
jgi:hypothetical protein